jgi:hypothetical protein
MGANECVSMNFLLLSLLYESLVNLAREYTKFAAFNKNTSAERSERRFDVGVNVRTLHIFCPSKDF